MQAVSCTSPEQVICPTKFINETQLTAFRNYCTPNITPYKSAVYLQLKAAPLWFSSVTSHQYSQRVTPQQTDLVTYRGKTDGAKVPFLVLQEAQLWYGSLLPTTATSRAQTLPFNLVTAALGTGTGRWPVLGKQMTQINPGARERTRGHTAILLLNYTAMYSLSAGWITETAL